MEFWSDLWVWIRLRLFPFSKELQELAEMAREIDQQLSQPTNIMSSEEFLAFIKSKPLPLALKQKLETMDPGLQRPDSDQ